MQLDPLKIEVASSITTRFLNLKLPSLRKPLALLIRDGGVLDEMELRTLVRAEKNRTEYFPTLGTFAILGDDDERYLKARLGAIQVLHTLVDLYEARDTSSPYTREELIEQSRARYGSANPEEIGLGLYVVVTEFGAIQSFERSQDGTQIATFTIAEQVLKITNPESAWTQRVVISRNNASVPAHSFESAAKLRFVDKVSEIYEPVLEKHRSLEQQYANAGIAEAGNFARLATDAVLNAFKEVEQAFRSVYFDPFKGRGLEPELNVRLATILEETLNDETTRAMGVAQSLCMSFIGSLSDRSNSIRDRVQTAGAKIKERLANVLTLLAIQDLHFGVPIESTPDSGSMTFEDPRPSTTHPQVFISYAWESEAVQQWVLGFATRLRENGVDVTLDQWHLDYGDDRLHFMERSVVSAGFVLIICTPQYAEKSDDRAGGVGYESNIITSRIAEKTDRQKFIPVLRSGDWKTSVPAWLKHVVGCNLTAEPYSEVEFKNLLKTLHRKRGMAPTLGPAPIFEDHQVSDGPATMASLAKPKSELARLDLRVGQRGKSGDVNTMKVIAEITNLSPSVRIREYSVTVSVPAACLTFESAKYPSEIQPDVPGRRRFRHTEKTSSGVQIHPGDKFQVFSLDIGIDQLKMVGTYLAGDFEGTLADKIVADAVVDGERLHVACTIAEVFQGISGL